MRSHPTPSTTGARQARTQWAGARARHGSHAGLATATAAAGRHPTRGRARRRPGRREAPSLPSPTSAKRAQPRWGPSARTPRRRLRERTPTSTAVAEQARWVGPTDSAGGGRPAGGDGGGGGGGCCASKGAAARQRLPLAAVFRRQRVQARVPCQCASSPPPPHPPHRSSGVAGGRWRCGRRGVAPTVVFLAALGNFNGPTSRESATDWCDGWLHTSATAAEPASAKAGSEWLLAGFGRAWQDYIRCHPPSAPEFSQDDRLFSRAAVTAILGSGKADYTV